MRLYRSVPISRAMMAVGEAMDHPTDPIGMDDTFGTWWTSRDRRGGQSILDHVSMTVEEVDALLPDVPETPAGMVWRTAVETLRRQTLDDVFRPFDKGEWDETETDIHTELDQFTADLRAVSPLLDPVADVIDSQIPFGVFYLGDVTTMRNRFTSEGVVIGGGDWCDKHDEDCYGDPHRVARWDHINALAPGTETRLNRLLDRLTEHMPSLGDHDNAEARSGSVGQNQRTAVRR